MKNLAKFCHRKSNQANPTTLIKSSFLNTTKHTPFYILATFFIVTASSPLNANLSSSQDPDPDQDSKATHRWTPIPMKTGAYSATDPRAPQNQLMNEQNRVHVNPEDLDPRVQNHILAFRHSFLIPDWLRVSLPVELSNLLPMINTLDMSPTPETPFDDLVAGMTQIVQVNGLGNTLEEASATPMANLIRLVNEIGFKEQGNPLEFSRTLVLLGTSLTNTEIPIGLNNFAKNDVASALYEAAANLHIQVIQHNAQLPDGVRLDGQGALDALISAAQLKRWSAYRSLHPRDRISRILQSIQLMTTAREVLPRSNGNDRKTELEALLNKEWALAHDLMREQIYAVQLAQQMDKRPRENTGLPPAKRFLPNTDSGLMDL